MAGHILLAEDDKALSALMQDFFRAAGVAVTPAYDANRRSCWHRRSRLTCWCWM